jgi:phosphohistidine phosphatase
MKVYVIRHAAAADEADYDRDEERPLTKSGKATMKSVARLLTELAIAPGRIYTSPLLRARETADITAKALGKGGPVEEAGQLAPGHAPVEVVSMLAESGLDEAAVVGHEPQLGKLVSLMVAGSDTPVVDMRKASVACVEFDGPAAAGGGVVAWHIVPEIARIMGK